MATPYTVGVLLGKLEVAGLDVECIREASPEWGGFAIDFTDGTFLTCARGFWHMYPAAMDGRFEEFQDGVDLDVLVESVELQGRWR